MHCTKCKHSPLVEEVRDYTLSHLSFTKVIHQHGWWCKSCGEAFLQEKDAKDLENEIKIFKSKIN